MKRLAWPDGLAFAALAAAAVGLVVCFGGLFIAPRSVIGAWLTVALFLLGLPLGALALLMVHGLTGGRWGDAMRPALRATVATLPLAARITWASGARSFTPPSAPSGTWSASDSSRSAVA